MKYTVDVYRKSDYELICGNDDLSSREAGKLAEQANWLCASGSRQEANSTEIQGFLLSHDEPDLKTLRRREPKIELDAGRRVIVLQVKS